MKKIFLIIVLLILITTAISLTYYVFQIAPKNELKEEPKQEEKKEENKTPGTSWITYWWELEENNEIIDKAENDSYLLNINDETITMCTFEPANCDEFNYKKQKEEYSIITDNKKILEANFKIIDAKDENGKSIIKINKYWDDGAISIFYLKKVNV